VHGTAGLTHNSHRFRHKQFDSNIETEKGHRKEAKRNLLSLCPTVLFSFTHLEVRKIRAS